MTAHTGGNIAPKAIISSGLMGMIDIVTKLECSECTGDKVGGGPWVHRSQPVVRGQQVHIRLQLQYERCRDASIPCASRPVGRHDARSSRTRLHNDDVLKTNCCETGDKDCRNRPIFCILCVRMDSVRGLPESSRRSTRNGRSDAEMRMLPSHAGRASSARIKSLSRAIRPPFAEGTTDANSAGARCNTRHGWLAYHAMLVISSDRGSGPFPPRTPLLRLQLHRTILGAAEQWDSRDSGTNVI